MNAKELLYSINPPCKKCPYRLGLVRTVVDPCLRCRMNHYSMYDRFCRERMGEHPEEDSDDTR